jgi:hypothetical protein
MGKLVCLPALVALCIPVSLSASSKIHKKGFTVIDPVQVQNVTLSPGHYQVTWMRMGSNVPVTIFRHNNALVTVPGHRWWKRKLRTTAVRLCSGNNRTAPRS